MFELSFFDFIIMLFIVAILPKVLKYVNEYINYKTSSYKDVQEGRSKNDKTGKTSIRRMKEEPFLSLITDKGAYGEFLIYRVLESINPNAKLLTNLYIPREDNSFTEVDLLMIDQTGIYVFESKNYSGWIFGSENNQYWTQTFPNKHKEKFYNPIAQNKIHINALKYITQIFDDDLFFSYIIFSQRCELKKIDIYSSNVAVIKRNSLKRAMTTKINSSRTKLSLQAVDDIYNVLLNYTDVDRDVEDSHIKRIKRKYN